MKNIRFSLIAILLLLGACSSTNLNLALGNMRLINSSDQPQVVMNYASKVCKSDFYMGASFIAKAGNEYRFKCVKEEENEILIPVPGSTIPTSAN